jgi:hypothetical protein
MTDHDLNQAVNRLLGPRGPEATCDECFDQLDAYVEREVRHRDAEHAMPMLAAHLRGCPACAEDHDSLLAFTRQAHPVQDPGAPR